MRIEENVRNIVTKYMRGESTGEELRKAISFFRNPELNQITESILFDVWNNNQLAIPKQYESKNLHSLLQQIHKKIEPEILEIRRRKVKQMISSSARLAAVLIIGLVMGISVVTFRKAEPEVYTSIAPKGSISQIILPDSTLVYLNADSELRYVPNRSNRGREVFLDGEAWFQVNEDKKRPFVVHTSFYDVIATGTEFNVKAYKDDNEIVTTLEKGSVTVPSTDKFKINSDRSLVPGQQLLYNREKNTVLTSNVETSYFTSWKDNKLIFINMSLEKLIILLERKYGVDIEVYDNSILKYHYDGTIQNESILEVMDIIKVTLPIQYEISDQTIQITKVSGGP
jgi:transmembrane sensor